MLFIMFWFFFNILNNILYMHILKGAPFINLFNSVEGRLAVLGDLCSKKSQLAAICQSKYPGLIKMELGM
jgi:hypothetical protein